MAYDQIREENIERNMKFLEDIGLGLKSGSNKFHSTEDAKDKSPIKKNSKKRVLVARNEPTRRSVRILSVPQPNYKEETISMRSISTTGRSAATVSDEAPNSDPNVNQDQDEGQGQDPWLTGYPPTQSKSKHQVIDPASCRAKDAHFEVFKLGIPVENTGKASIMSLANLGSIPKFSKYSGVVQWSNSYFLWVNIIPSNLRSKNDGDMYPNEFLEGGKRMTWFGGSLMRPDSEITQDLLACGSFKSSEEAVSNRRYGNICLFVREVGQPYAYFGKVSVFEVNLTVKPIRITWILNDYELLKDVNEFTRIVELCNS